MASFSPPTRLERPQHSFNDPGVLPAANRMGQHRGAAPVGKNVARKDGVFQIVGILESDVFEAFGEDGVDRFYGGHVYEVSGDLADELDADLGTGFVDSNPYANGYGDPY